MATIRPPLIYGPLQPYLPWLPPTITRLSPVSGSLTGESVAVFGTSFIGVISVDFNGVPALFSVHDERWLTVVVPGSQLAGPIRVTTRRGVAAAYLQSTGRATFNASASAVVTWTTPMSDSNYFPLFGRPVVVDGGASVAVSVDGTTLTTTNCTLNADAAFSGYVDGFAFHL